MKNTWLVFFSKHKLIFFKHYFLLYFNLILSFNFFFFFLKNEKTKKKYFFINNIFKKNIFTPESPNSSFFHIKTFLNFAETRENTKSITKIKNPLKWAKFVFYFLFGANAIIFNANSYYKFFYLINYKKNVLLININKLQHVWNNGFNFLFNFFYFSFNFLLFGSFFFKNEILSYNWNNSILTPHNWKYSYSFFVYKTNTFSSKVDFFFWKLNEQGIDFSLVIDTFFHFKNIFYFKKNNIYTFGLIPFNLNPWIVNYAFPILNLSLLTQYFFLKILLLIQKNSLLYKFNLLKKYWAKLNIF